MIGKFKISFFLLAVFLYTNLFSEIKIKPLLSESMNDSSIFVTSSTRTVRLFNQNWKVFSENNPQKKITTSLPCSFEGEESLIFENKLYLTKEEIQNYTIRLYFLGVNHSVDITINKYNIFKKFGCEVPFEVEIPKDILKSDAANVISIKVSSGLDAENTIPLNQRFLFPKNSAGILRDVYLEFIPATYISDVYFSFSFYEKQALAIINAELTIKNLKLLTNSSGSDEVKNATRIEVNLQPKNFTSSFQNFVFVLNDKAETKRQFQFLIQNPALWSPQSPNVYICKISLFNGSQLIDELKREISIFDLKLDNKLTLNNSSFTFNGTTYYLNEADLKKITAYQKIKEDLALIKESGFNAVRFAKAYPNPYALKVCQQLGLFAFVELPLNSVPEEILTKEEFQVRAQNRFKEIVQQYQKFSNALIFGLGSSYLPNSEITKAFLQKLLNSTGRRNILNYASFIGIPKDEYEDITLYGLELYSYPADSLLSILPKLKDNLQKYFISEINYPNYIGSSSGYLVKNSSEAQAKYFEKIIDVITEQNFSGFFINSLFNYSGDFSSLYGGNNNTYKLGLIDINHNINSLPYRVIESKLNEKQKVTIPIGISKSENKLLFILISIGLSLVLAILINTRKKFKEDCTRALFRSYNFFADLRDHRILSSLHTIILMFIEIGSMALLFTILLFYLRTNILLEKILLSFGENWLINSISYLAWNPEKCFIYFFILFLIKIIVISLIIKLASLFIKTRIEFSSIFYGVVWSFFPSTLLLPVELVLYRILAIGTINIFVIVLILILIFWILQRIFKGIYVLFDVNPVKVYFYGLLLIVIIAGSTLLYYQITNSSIYYIGNTIKQYNLMLH